MPVPPSCGKERGESGPFKWLLAAAGVQESNRVLAALTQPHCRPALRGQVLWSHMALAVLAARGRQNSDEDARDASDLMSSHGGSDGTPSMPKASAAPPARQHAVRSVDCAGGSGAPRSETFGKSVPSRTCTRAVAGCAG